MTDLVGVTGTSSWPSATNQTEVSSSAGCGPMDSSGRLFFILVYTLVFLVGVVLNSFVVKFYFCRALQTSSSMMVYLKNLAAADFLLCLCLPIRISNYASSSTTVRLIYCNFGVTALFLNMTASILFMGYIAANRYLRIVRPSGTHILQSVQAAHIISILSWVFLVTTSGVYVTLLFFTHKPLTSAPVSCDDLYSAQILVFYKMLHACTTTMFLFVLFSLVFFYYSISRSLSLAQRSQPASSDSTTLVRSRRNMLVLVSVFCLCFVPYHLLRLPYVFLWKKCPINQVLYYLKELTVLASVLNVCLDPLIYFIFCKAFRAQMNPRTYRVHLTNKRAQLDC